MVVLIFYYISIYTKKIPTNERAVKVLAKLTKVCRNLHVGLCELQEMLAKCCLYVEGEVISDTIKFCAIPDPSNTTYFWISVLTPIVLVKNSTKRWCVRF